MLNATCNTIVIFHGRSVFIRVGSHSRNDIADFLTIKHWHKNHKNKDVVLKHLTITYILYDKCMQFKL